MNLDWPHLKSRIAATPAFVLDEDRVVANLRPLQAVREATGCKLLYSMKALPLARLLELLRGEVDGISASSLFEARLAEEVWQSSGDIHITTPGLRADEFAEVASLCSHVSFNSLSQWRRLHELGDDFSSGLRVNPKLSFLEDKRYDPCRPYSKLGVDIADLRHGLPNGIQGLHFHTVFACEDWAPLQQTLARLMPVLESSENLRWLNFGGGYRYERMTDWQPLIAIIQSLREKTGLEIYLEPGKAVVGNAGYLVSAVVDRFVSDGKTLLVLDTSVNHNPEVFEYQRKPFLLDDVEDGERSALLVGGTCLAGDVFGEYRFRKIPEIGDKLVFGDVGAYTLIKANRFNGYNLPEIYALRAGNLEPIRRFGYRDYRRQWR